MKHTRQSRDQKGYSSTYTALNKIWFRQTRLSTIQGVMSQKSEGRQRSKAQNEWTGQENTITDTDMLMNPSGRRKQDTSKCKKNRKLEHHEETRHHARANLSARTNWREARHGCSRIKHPRPKISQSIHSDDWKGSRGWKQLYDGGRHL